MLSTQKAPSPARRAHLDTTTGAPISLVVVSRYTPALLISNTHMKNLRKLEHEAGEEWEAIVGHCRKLYCVKFKVGHGVKLTGDEPREVERLSLHGSCASGRKGRGAGWHDKRGNHEIRGIRRQSVGVSSRG